MPKAKVKKVRKRKPTWDDQMALIIAAGGAGSAIEEASGLGPFKTSFFDEDEEITWLNERYEAETDYMLCVISDLIDRLHAVVDAAGLNPVKDSSDGS